MYLVDIIYINIYYYIQKLLRQKLLYLIQVQLESGNVEPRDPIEYVVTLDSRLFRMTFTVRGESLSEAPSEATGLGVCKADPIYRKRNLSWEF